MVWAIDTETSGIKDPEVIEFAHAEIKAKPGPVFEMGESIVDRYKPTKPIELGALATHHILPEELDGCPPSPETFALPRLVIGHNVDFDWEALGSPEGVMRIDTLALARETWPGLDSYKLGALTYHLFPGKIARDLLKGAHSATVDISLCFEVFKRALAALPNPIANWTDVWRASEAARIPKIMAFGKHEGLPIADVPRDYVEWYARQDDTDPYLIKAFANAGLIRQEN
jgi:exodeoxyribonuclease X